MIHFLAILIPAILLLIVGIATCSCCDDDRYTGFGVLGCVLSAGAILFVIIAYAGSSGALVPILTQTFTIQELRLPSGGTIQVIVEDSGKITNLTALTGKSFPKGSVQHQWLSHEPNMHLYWDTERDYVSQWVSLEVKERQ